MRWIVCGEQTEWHVHRSLIDALVADGDDVVHLPSLLPNVGPFRSDDDRDAIWARRVDESLPADVLLVMRPDEVPPAVVRAARERGATAIVWFSDDPVLYEVTSRHVVDAYDITLHTGRADVLEWYEQRHGVRGYTFPWWTSDAYFPYAYDPAGADVDIGFIGSLGGPRRQWRYELLAGLPFAVRFYGLLARGRHDYAGIGGGFYPLEEMQRLMSHFAIGLNIAQRFDDDRAHPYFFDDLPRFGEFYFPSRLVTYPAAGIPTITVQSPDLAPPIATTITVATRAELVDRARALLGDPDALLAASRATRAEFEACLSARSRVSMLRSLVGGARDEPLAERAVMWRRSGPVASPPTPPPPRPVAPSPAVEPLPPAVTSVRLVVFGVGEEARDLVAGARASGLDVGFVDLEETPSAGQDPLGTGTVTIDGTVLERLVDRWMPAAVLFVGSCRPSTAATAAARAAGVRSVAVAGEGIARGSAMRWADAIVVADPRLAAELRKADRPVVEIEPAVALGRPADGAGVRVHGDGPEADVVAARLAEIGALAEGSHAVELFVPGAVCSMSHVLRALARGALPIVPAAAALPFGDTGLERYTDIGTGIAVAGYYAGRPEEARAVVGAGRERIASSYRWEERWGDIAESLGLSSRPRPVALVFGYYGQGNVGDELILQEAAGRIDASMIVIGQRADGVVARHGVPALSALDAAGIDAALRDADVLIVGGGGLLHDREIAAGASIEDIVDEPKRAGMAGVIARTVAAARAQDVPVALWNVGVDPPASAGGARVLRAIAERAAPVIVRDAGSAAALRASGFDGAIVVGADPVVLHEIEGRAEARAWLDDVGVGDGYVVVSLRPGFDRNGLGTRLASAADAIADATGLDVVFAPCQPTGSPNDAAVARAVERSMRRRAVVADDPATTPALIAGARLCIGMRLHASILAAVAGVPSIGLAYASKVLAFYQEIGRPDDALGIDVTSEAIVARAMLRLEDASVPDIGPLRERALGSIRALAPLLGARRRRRVSDAQRQESLAAFRRDLAR